MWLAANEIGLFGCSTFSEPAAMENTKRTTVANTFRIIIFNTSNELLRKGFLFGLRRF